MFDRLEYIRSEVNKVYIIMMIRLRLLCLLAIIAQVLCENSFPDFEEFAGEKAGFHIIGGEEYYINTDILYPWVQAAQSCNVLNMKLLSLETQFKNDVIKEYLMKKDFNGSYWTSGHKIIETWYWTGLGQVFGYTDWRDGQPDSEALELAVTINSYFNFLWEDMFIEGNFAFTICEPHYSGNETNVFN